MNISKNNKLVPSIAEQLIIELFAGQTKELKEIKTRVEEVHKQRGGLPFTSKYHPVQMALTKLKKNGVAENPQLRYWSIPIRKLEDFINWVKQFQEGEFIFRGVPNAAFEIQASASLRPHIIEQMYIEKQHDEEKRIYNKYLYINKELIRKSKQRGYDKKDGKEFNILDILAELQHYGAATCLIDFTCSAQIALWFACQPYQKSKDEHQDKKDKKKETEDSTKHVNGKVYAVKHVPPRSSGLPKCIEITPEFLEKDAEKKKDISYFLKEEKNAPLYYYQPKFQNHRIIAQQSVFLFGQYKFKADNECIIAADCKGKILNELHKSSGLTEDKLFPDFEGFARWVQSKDSPYTEPTPSALKARSRTVFDKSHATEIEFEEIIGDLSRAIIKDDNDVEAYNLRGRAYTRLEDFGNALEDFAEAEKINPDDAETYYNRGYLYQQQGQYQGAIDDYDTAISKKEDYAEAYYNRGLSKYNDGQEEEALEDFTEVIHLKPDFIDAYFQRGLILQEFEEYPSALDDFNKAIEINPNDMFAYFYRAETMLLFLRVEEERQDLEFAAMQDLEFALELAEQEKNEEMVVKISTLLQEFFGHNTSEEDDE